MIRMAFRFRGDRGPVRSPGLVWIPAALFGLVLSAAPAWGADFGPEESLDASSANGADATSYVLDPGGTVIEVTGNGTYTYTLSGLLSGTGGLTKNGGGTLVLGGGPNTYTGATVVIGGVLSIANWDSINPDATGNAVSDQATLHSSNELRIGYSGAGTLDITGGGAASSDSSIYLGYNAGSAGTVTVDGDGSALSADYHLYVGNYGAGTLNVKNGAAASAGGNVHLGYNDGSAGTVTVDGSTMSVDDALTVGSYGTGVLEIKNGGTVSAGDNMTMANNAGSAGTVTVDGVGSTLSTLNMLYVGRGDNATLDITNGGTVSAASDINLGSLGTGNGTATVDGAGSELRAGGMLIVGSSGTGTLEIKNGGMASVAGNIYLGYTVGSGTVTVDGAGSTLSTAGRLEIGRGGTGALDINNGGTATAESISVNAASRLAVSGAGTLGDGDFAGDITNNGAILFDQTVDQTLSGVISGTGGLTKSGAGTLTLTGDNTYTGSTTVNGGVLQLGDGGATGYITGDITNNANVTFNRSDTIGFYADISGTGGLTKKGAGSVHLAGHNTYSGDTHIVEGTVLGEIARDTNLTVAADTTYNGDHMARALNALNGAGAVQDTLGLTVQRGDFSGELIAVGDLTKTSDGTLTLSGGSYSLSGVEVKEGTLKIGAAGAATDFTATGYTTKQDAATEIAAGSHLTVNGDFTQETEARLVLAVNADRSAVITVDGDAALAGTYEMAGIGGIAPAKASDIGGKYVLVEATGAITDNGFTADGGLAATADYLVYSSGVSADGKKYETGFSLAWNEDSALATGVFTVADGASFEMDLALADNNSTHIEPALWDGKSLTKQGAGTLVLSAANTYTGATVVAGGTLAITDWDRINSDATGNAVRDGAALRSSASLRIGSSGIGTLDITGGGTASADGDIHLGYAANSTGAVTVDGAGSELRATGNLIVGSSGAGTLDIKNGGTATAAGIAVNAASSLAVRGAGTLGDGDFAGDINNNGAILFDQSVDQTLSGAITGKGSLTKSGTGTLTLDGGLNRDAASAADAGDLDVSDGALAIAGQGNYANHVTVSDNGILGLNAGSAAALSATTLTFQGDGGLNIAGTIKDGATLIATTDGVTDFDPGRVTIGGGADADYLHLTTRLVNDGHDIEIFAELVWNMTGGGTFTLADASDEFTVAQALTDQTPSDPTAWDGQSLRKAGDGTLILAADNTFTGDTVIKAGVLQVGDGTSGSLGNGDYAGNIANDGALVFNQAADQTLTGVISGAGGLAKTGAGALTLANAANDYSGGTTVDGGVLRLAGKDAAGTGDVALGEGGTLELAFADTFDNRITGAGGLVKTGAAALARAAGGTTLTLTNAANDYSGGTTVNDGVLRLTAAGAAGTGEVALGSAATLELAFADTFGNKVAGDGGLSVDAGAGGAAILAGANDYTGMTTVLSGTLELGGDLTASAGLALHNGTTFKKGAFNHSLDNKSLTVRGSGSTYDGDLSARGATLDFIAPGMITDTMLSVTGAADVDGTVVNIGVEGDAVIDENIRLSLLKTPNDPNGVAGAARQGRGSHQGAILVGSTVEYDLVLKALPDELIAIAGGGRARKGAKALSEGYLGGLALAWQGADLAAGAGLDAAAQTARDASQSGGYGLTTFAALSGGKARYDTGSHVDMKSFNLMAGLAKGADTSFGRATGGVFLEYGNGNYDTFNTFANAPGVNGDGDTDYLGGGLLGRLEFADFGPGHFHTEASARLGGLRNDYRNSDLRDAGGRRAAYDSSTTYYGAHLGGGYVWKVTDKASLDMHGQYFWTRQRGDSVTLSTGERVAFENADSHRARGGVRYSYAANKCIAPYIGAAYEYEFAGQARAKVNRLRIDAPTLRGGTVAGEAGLMFKPAPTRPITLDFGVQGYAGKREGVTGRFAVNFAF